MKKFLAVIFAVLSAFSSVTVAFAENDFLNDYGDPFLSDHPPQTYAISPSKTYFFKYACEYTDNGYLLEFSLKDFLEKNPNYDISRVEGFINSYNYYRSSIGDPNKTIFCCFRSHDTYGYEVSLHVFIVCIMG